MSTAGAQESAAPVVHPSDPHPSVVRIQVQERGAESIGSGTLVAVHGQHGVVVTNWHVVRDAAGPVMVHFADGFRSQATTLVTDRDWDLAALLIWRPRAAPVPIATVAPRPGDPLTIAGYGEGTYRAVSGYCTQYVSPGLRFPYEMVELSAQARQGDSGGPILNARGELAGVLFGAGGGSTSGSYCRRVARFLEPVWARLKTAPPAPPAPPAPANTAPANTAPANTTPETAASPPAADLQAQSLVPYPRPASSPEHRLASTPIRPRVPRTDSASDSAAPTATRSPRPLPRASSDSAPAWQDVVGDTWLEQAKTVLAAIGILSILATLFSRD